MNCSIVKFVPILEMLQNGEYDDMLQFKLINKESSSGFKGFTGAYVISDNGYLDWTTNVKFLRSG
jgi:hypothetical protein